MSIETITYRDNTSTSHNVQDKFLNLTTEQIKEELLAGRSKMITVCMNLTSDFNKASIIRANNAFLGKEVIIVGKKKFDRRGTVGTHHYEIIKHADTFEDVAPVLQANGYTLFAVDNIDKYNPTPIYDIDLPEKSAFVYGEEQAGLSETIIEQCDSMIYIPQYGSVRSINVAQAAAVTMSEYSRRWRRDN